MSSENPTVLLDVSLEWLYDILRDKDWNVETVTKKLGPNKEDRSDDRIIKYAIETGCIVVTEDADLITRCKLSDIETITMEREEKAKIILQKLKNRYSE